MAQHAQKNRDDIQVGADLRELVRRAEQGDETAVPELRALLQDHPDFWHMYADLGAHAQEAWVALASGNNHALREALRLKMDSLREELAGPSQAPLEQLLVERVVLGWLQANYGSLYFAQLKGRSPSQAQIKVAADFEDRAQRRFLAALRHLAQMRKLLRPALSPVDVAARFAVPETVVPTPDRWERCHAAAPVEN